MPPDSIASDDKLIWCIPFVLTKERKRGKNELAQIKPRNQNTGYVAFYSCLASKIANNIEHDLIIDTEQLN